MTWKIYWLLTTIAFWVYVVGDVASDIARERDKPDSLEGVMLPLGTMEGCAVEIDATVWEELNGMYAYAAVAACEDKLRRSAENEKGEAP